MSEVALVERMVRSIVANRQLSQSSWSTEERTIILSLNRVATAAGNYLGSNRGGWTLEVLQ